MLQKGFDLILVPSIADAKRRIFEDKEIELILCDVELPDGTAMELFHALRRVAGMFQMKNPPVRLLEMDATMTVVLWRLPVLFWMCRTDFADIQNKKECGGTDNGKDNF